MHWQCIHIYLHWYLKTDTYVNPLGIGWLGPYTNLWYSWHLAIISCFDWYVCIATPCIKSTAGTGADVALVNVACNTTIELTCSDPSGFLPSWFMNGVVVFGDHYSSSSDVNTGVVTGTLTINGNHTYGAFNVYCSLHNDQILHNTSVTVQG